MFIHYSAANEFMRVNPLYNIIHIKNMHNSIDPGPNDLLINIIYPLSYIINYILVKIYYF